MRQEGRSLLDCHGARANDRMYSVPVRRRALDDPRRRSRSATLARASPRNILRPYSAEWDPDHAHPAEALAIHGSGTGFFGMLLPEVQGGSKNAGNSPMRSRSEIAANNGAVSTII